MHARRRALMLGALVALFLPGVVRAPVHAAASCAAAEHPGGEWRAFGPDLANSRSQAQEAVIGVEEARTLAPDWTFDVAEVGGDGGFTGTPVVADGCLFVASDGGDVFALNADTGEEVWHVRTPTGAGVSGTLAVVDGLVFGLASRSGSPHAFALHEADGATAWSTQLDDQPGSDAFASPVVFNGLVFAGVSGGSAEVTTDEDERYAFQGAFVLLDALSGGIVKKTYTIHDPSFDDGFAGATIWSTPAVDTETGFAYVGTGNPFQPQKEHAHANSVIKVDMRRDSPTVGEIVGNYKGNVDEFFQGLDQLPCQDIDGNPPPWYPQGAGACGDIDLDFGASPNIFRDGAGRKLVGDGQKAGVYHAFDAESLAGVWKTQVGPPGAVGGIVGTAAVTPAGIAGPITPAGYLWSVGTGGSLQWASPVGDGAHWGHQTSAANGVVYTMDLKGFLDAYDASSGVPLLHAPIGGPDRAAAAAGGLGGGVAIARNTVYAPANGLLSAFRPGTAVVDTPDAPPLPAGPSGAGLAIVTGPGGFAAGYATRAIVVPKGMAVTYVNGDIAKHDVVSKQYGPSTQPWCGNWPLGRCPLLSSDLIPVGETTPVLGLENTLPGATYDFYCTLHPNMQGQLIVPPS